MALGDETVGHSYPWDPCEEDACQGIVAGASGRCMAHLDDQAEVERSLVPVKAGRLDLRGVEIDEELLQRVLRSAPRDAERELQFTNLKLDGATFTTWADFVGADLGSGASFRGTVFKEGASFQSVRFGAVPAYSEPDFSHSTFESGVQFTGASFGDGASFRGARFLADPLGNYTFQSVSFGERGCFSGTVFEQAVVFSKARFDHNTDLAATFRGDADFRQAQFGDDASLEGAAFDSTADFTGAEFGSRAVIAAEFSGPVTLHRAKFGERTRFDAARFVQGADFTEAIIEADSSFGSGTRFGEAASFLGAQFRDRVRFEGANFAHKVSFSGARFGDNVLFDRVLFSGGADFAGARFGERFQFNSVLVIGVLELREAAFGIAPRFCVGADRLECDATKFSGGVKLQLRWAEISLDGTEFAGSSVIEEASNLALDTPMLQEREHRLVALARSNGQSYRTEKPRLVCVNACDMKDVVLIGVDLRACRFAGSYGLDKLRLEGDVVWSSTPSKPLWFGWALPPFWRWSFRRTIADEHHWRATRRKNRGWDQPQSQAPWHAEAHRNGWPVPSEVVELYRALRKAREDQKDEPGAADFYYGEMEMRRRRLTGLSTERMVLWLYWLISGYGLRALRAAIALVVFLAVFSALLFVNGLEEPKDAWARPSNSGQGVTSTTSTTVAAAGGGGGSPVARAGGGLTSIDAWTMSGGMALGIVTGIEVKLTRQGRVYRTILRIGGPVLLAFVVVALRGRVKR
jgi:uncharacterized protein YjbI with pentapeptide repeats